MNDTPVLQHLPVAVLHANMQQPRKEFDPDELHALAESIRQVGLLQPVLARPQPAGQFEIVAGERRVRAARMVGLTHIPVLVWNTDQKQAFLLAVAENTSRADLNPLEEAAAYRVLEDDLGLTQAEIAQRIGRSRQHVGNMMRLLRLPSNVQRLISEGLVSAGHGRALVPVRDPFACYLLAQRVVDEALSVRAVEDIVTHGRYYGAEGNSNRPPTPPKPTVTRSSLDMAEVEEWLDTRITDTKPRGATPGAIAIRYADADDRERLVALLQQAAAHWAPSEQFDPAL